MMNFNENIPPKVRIGMIQSAEEICFHCDGTFYISDLVGNILTPGEPNRPYKIRLKVSKKAAILYSVRIAIRDDKTAAEKLQSQLLEQDLETQLWHPGVCFNIGSFTLDNREYWVVTTPFADLKSAEQFAKDYKPAGDAVVVKSLQNFPCGTLLFEDMEIEDGIRILADENSFIFLEHVPVGIDFHWQHQRTQKLLNVLEVRINCAGQLEAINEIDMEEYLVSVNSSEMTSENPTELLKAQTIAARSTLLATMGKHHYDQNYHLCSDDHCQCYHGMENVSDSSMKAGAETYGCVLLYNDKVCDARYAKICGGISEDFENVWDNRSIPYLRAAIDARASLQFPVSDEIIAKKYIDGWPDVYCNTEKYKITSHLPYNTKDLFRWKVSYEKEELQNLIKKNIQEDIGDLIDIITGERGRSGRLIYIDIVGSDRTIRIGKELQIRHVLSESHLYSACFYIERQRNDRGEIVKFDLIGAGWGHGVGLCQVGATVMAQMGHDFRDILEHYYKGATIIKLY